MNKKIIYGVATILIVSGIVGTHYYQKIFGANITKNSVLYIGSNNSLLDIKKAIDSFSKSSEDFVWVAHKKKFKTPKKGKYLLKEGMSSNDVINLLRSGNQTPIKISFNNQDSLEKLASRIAAQIETDSISLLNAFKNKSFLAEKKFTLKTVLGMFIPNSYEFYWSVSAEKFRDRMFVEYEKFWNKERLSKAKKLHLSPQEVITLASIVQEETKKQLEKPIVAGLYLNRLKSGWPLQADPTIKYAVKQQKGQNFIIKRVLNKDITTTKNSPYNTYKKKGLPPGLIAMPDISSIDAVLNAKKHNYFYMCASADKIGYHAFANSLRAHNRNANKYHRWLKKQGINR